MPETAALTVHLIFKTHLDVGFTGFAADVVRGYFESFIPEALRVARELRERGGEERFVWTTGSWLIYEYLEQADARQRAAMEEGIAAGDIRWHALPFTTHTEAMTPDLFRFGLGLSRELDRRFGTRTIAAKMTDVPGHTRSMVPLLAEAGVRFLHIGVNPASRAPDVPPLFRWRAPDGSAVTVMYDKGGYGGVLAVDGLADTLVFAHTGDNHGPQSADEIVAQYGKWRERFPNARLAASTLDAFAAKLATVEGRLPVIEGELGDTWIHGIGTDPRKVAEFRALCRLQSDWLGRGLGERIKGFSRRLLLVPEHTWGLDVKTHLGDYVNYARPAFEAVRRRDVVDAAVPEAIAFLGQFRKKEERRYSRLERSWAEQRAYLDQARQALDRAELRAEAEAALAELRPAAPETTGCRWLTPGERVSTAHFQVELDCQTGAISRLQERTSGREWVSGRRGVGLVRYQTFSAADYERYLGTYNVNMEHDWCSSWAIPDFGKPGLRPEDSPSALHLPRVRRAGVRRLDGAESLVVELDFDEALSRDFGAPRTVWVEYLFPDAVPELRMRVQWFGKPANRMPEALWCSFGPAVPDPAGWQLDKLGGWVSPLEVVRHGNRNLHGIDRGVRCVGSGDTLHIDSLDAALVAPGRPRLLEFDDTPPELAGGMHFNLYNNLWGTNFPMWYGEDALFRFTLRRVGA